MITEPILPIVILPLTFLFVLLIILVTKAPKAGAWVVGSLVLVASIVLYRFAMAGALRQEEALPLFILPLTFLFVLMVILLSKAPKVGVLLIVALVAMVVLGLFLVPVLSHRHAAYAPAATEYPITQAIQQTENGAGRAVVIQEFNRVFDSHVQPPSVPAPTLPSRPVPPPPSAPAPIWSQGVDREFEADVYPSQLAAIRALGLRLDRAVRELIGDVNSPPQITLFQGELERALIVELKNTIQRVLPQAACAIEAELRNLRPGEVGVMVRLVDIDVQRAPWAQTAEIKTENEGVSVVHRSVVVRSLESVGSGAASGRLEIDVFSTASHVTAHKRFVEKPWIENFAAFASTRPEQHFIVTRSRETCTSESEARQQALEDARARLTEALGIHAAAKFAGLAIPEVTAADVLQGGFIVDQFAQSFDGTAGKIWRQAMLIDVAGAKLRQLSRQKIHESRQIRETWARMGFSVIGVLVLIAVIYFFLNMATMGYYEWSLRIAGVVLAIVAIISILMIVK